VRDHDPWPHRGARSGIQDEGGHSSGGRPQYNVTSSELLSSRRTANVVRPRQGSDVYMAKNATLALVAESGRRWAGGRDHNTVAAGGLRKIEALVARISPVEGGRTLKRPIAGVGCPPPVDTTSTDHPLCREGAEERPAKNDRETAAATLP